MCDCCRDPDRTAQQIEDAKINNCANRADYREFEETGYFEAPIQMRLLKSSIVALSPSSSDTLGSQPNTSFARVISGLRC